VQSPGVDQQLAETRSSTTSYYEADGLGSVTSLSSSSGSLTNTYSYDSYGKLTASTGTITNPYRYTGREVDSETGLDYYRARYYDQTAGRFLTEDPGGFDQGSNFYEYAANNPAAYIDPFGLAAVSPQQLLNDINTAINMALSPKCMDFILDAMKKALRMRRVQQMERGLHFDGTTARAQDGSINIGTFLTTMLKTQKVVTNEHPNWSAHAGEFTIWIDQGYEGPETWIHETFHLSPYAFSDQDMADALGAHYKVDPRNQMKTIENASSAWDCLLKHACK
jgi:RHS repeat-associated protein